MALTSAGRTPLEVDSVTSSISALRASARTAPDDSIKTRMMHCTAARRRCGPCRGLGLTLPLGLDPV